jgi:hypothetical protein
MPEYKITVISPFCENTHGKYILITIQTFPISFTDTGLTDSKMTLKPHCKVKLKNIILVFSMKTPFVRLLLLKNPAISKKK